MNYDGGGKLSPDGKESWKVKDADGGEDTGGKASGSSSFYHMQAVKRSRFADDHVRSSICARYFAIFAFRFIRVANEKAKRGVDLDVGDVLDINSRRRGDEAVTKTQPMMETDQTHEEIRRFQSMIKESVAAEKNKGKTPDYYRIVRNNLVRLYLPDVIGNILLTIIGESFAVYYTYQIQELIKFIKEPVDTVDPEGQTWRGVRVIATFGTSMYLG